MKQEKSKGMTRREFARASAVAGLAAVGVASSSRTARAANADTLKVGLLGCGSRGSGALRDCLTGNKNVRVIALADLFDYKVKDTRDSIEKAFADQNGIDDGHCFVGLDAYKQILETDIDILIEGTLPYSRPKHIVAAVEAKKHIFSEKPFASEPAGVRMIIDACRKHKEQGFSFVGGTQRRHNKAYIDTIKKIHDGAIGDVAAMRVYWCGGLPFTRDRNPGESDFSYRIRNWYAYCWVCGDNIVEQHIHNLDVANWVLDAHPTQVFASGGRIWKPRNEKYGDLWDHFSCDYTYPNDVHVFSFSRHWDGCAGDVSEWAYGSKGKSKCCDMGDGGGTRDYVQEHIDLVKSITGEGPYYHEGERIAESTLTAIMGRMSAYTGKVVTWDEAMKADLSLVPEEWSFEKEYPVGPIPCPVQV
ncbi:MAG: Gfo/Idh/MocA family oxidoreductase [Candidatus Hydrogenedentes bacterium]|nr:Gfo/Idh/MocA family oxidoreductase [Candidatus Hydrogenedentota bacterium]